MNPSDAFQVTRDFERALCDYTGAPYAIAVDSCSNGLHMALARRFQLTGPTTVAVPRHTYVSVPCTVRNTGHRLEWYDNGHDGKLRGRYCLRGTNIWDSALQFTAGMYVPGTVFALSFTGPYKHLRLGKGGALLLDNRDEAEWFRRARFSGRREVSYLVDRFDMLGWNFYMMPEVAARGLLMMNGMYDGDGNPVRNPDLEFKFPDLSAFPIFTEGQQ